MQISEVAKEFGLTTDTLRYYEREGLIGPIAKGKNGIRNYTEEDIKRIQFVKCMRAAGLEISFLKRYLQLFEGGDKTVKERRTKHRICTIFYRKFLFKPINQTRRNTNIYCKCNI